LRIGFGDKDLQKLYESGESRKFRLPKHIVLNYIKRIEAIKAAETIGDLMVMRSYKFEKLQGYSNRYSMRINDQYRLEMTLEDGGNIYHQGHYQTL